ncbi:MAG: hypothetical protein K9I69_03305 [Ignavibacteriales bacterium]|nr:hypothetical protein [Ignavibacteriales bacterium]MCF8305688.1 hypothetical protein [Ignavibacteriales bacterium]MCF8315410.1 hypothetical protein [Ignavibacteriales bacterium]MCF8436698.1 hypothetical protein [Ignavibacteriales bacterium]
MDNKPVRADELQEMLTINKVHKEYYETDDPSLKSQGNFLTKIWTNLRNSQILFRREL